MPEICLRSLILLAMVAKRLELAGNSVLRSVIMPSCQMKPWDQLKLESQVLPTTWPLLLMPLLTGSHVTAAQVKNKISRTLSRGGPAVRSRIPRET
jgi:hypothetical protein